MMLSKIHGKNKNYDIEKSEFHGNLKYSSICRISDTLEFILSGGCSSITNEATKKCYSFKLDGKLEFKSCCDLIYQRYGHCSTYCNGYVLVIGGFMMNDSIGSEPATLSSCEKYISGDDIWVESASLNTARSYAGVTKIHQFVYVFGGLCDFIALDTFEKYDPMLDFWKKIELKLPFRVAKMGVSKLEPNRSIIICGGLYCSPEREFSYINTSYKLDFKTSKWIKLSKMNEYRILYSNLPRINDKIYLVGGSFEGKCECYNIGLNTWEEIEGYYNLLQNDDFQTFALINISEFN